MSVRFGAWLRCRNNCRNTLHTRSREPPRGISFDLATAISVMQRLADKGLNTLIGWICYVFARRRYSLTGASLFRFEMPRAEETVGAGPG